MPFSIRHIAFIIMVPLYGWSAFPAGAGTAEATKPPEVRYANRLLSVEADNTSILDVLRALSENAGIDVSVSADFIPEPVSLRISEQPMEDALKHLLKGANYAVLYLKEREGFRITAVKVYPEGTYSGEMIPISAEKQESTISDGTGEIKTVLVGSGQEVITQGSILDIGQDTGRLGPSRSRPNFQGGAAPKWFALQNQFDHQEARQYEELMRHKLRVDATDSSDRKEALAEIYADEVSKFYEMKKAHLNKIEALKRIYDHNTITLK